LENRNGYKVLQSQANSSDCKRLKTAIAHSESDWMHRKNNFCFGYHYTCLGYEGKKGQEHDFSIFKVKLSDDHINEKVSLRAINQYRF